MLIVNKHCAIFTTCIKRKPSIKRTLGKVPKVSASLKFHCINISKIALLDTNFGLRFLGFYLTKMLFDKRFY